MRFLSALCGALVLFGSSIAAAGGIQGEYVEARTADIYTGPCFSNAEVLIYGDQAGMAWNVTDGSLQGVNLSGLTVAAAVRGTTTFSEDKPELARSVLIVDEKADSQQREALIAMAKTLGGKRLENVSEIKTARLSLKIENHATAAADPAQASHGMPHAPRASFWASGLAHIVTRPL